MAPINGANLRSKSDVATAVRAWESKVEFHNLKDSLANAIKELTNKDRAIETLQEAAKHVKRLESELTEKDALLETTRIELNSLRSYSADMDQVLQQKRKQVEDLESELERCKEYERQARMEHAAARLMDRSGNHHIKKKQQEKSYFRKDKRSPMTPTLPDDIDSLKNELIWAMEAEENSKRAMDDLAVALKEVATEANQAKQKQHAAEEQLGILRKEMAKMQSTTKSKDENYDSRLKEFQKENDTLKNTIARLRQEAEDSLIAWSEKEIEFVKCIKKAEDEKDNALAESTRLIESFRAMEERCEKARKETLKLRDIMKQALNEANVSKEAAEIAKAENSQLKDVVSEKDKALNSLAQETELLRINQAELKKQIPSPAKKDSKAEEKDHKKPHKKEILSVDREAKASGRSASSTFCQLPIPGFQNHRYRYADDDADDDIMDSIFDLVDPQPGQPSNHHQHHQHRNHHDAKAHSLTDEEKEYLEDLEHADHGDERHHADPSKKKGGLLIKRFGDLWKKKTPASPNQNQNENENSTQNQIISPKQTQNSTQNQIQNQNQSPKQIQSQDQNLSSSPKEVPST